MSRPELSLAFEGVKTDSVLLILLYINIEWQYHQRKLLICIVQNGELLTECRQSCEVYRALRYAFLPHRTFIHRLTISINHQRTS